METNDRVDEIMVLLRQQQAMLTSLCADSEIESNNSVRLVWGERKWSFELVSTILIHIDGKGVPDEASTIRHRGKGVGESQVKYFEIRHNNVYYNLFTWAR